MNKRKNSTTNAIQPWFLTVPEAAIVLGIGKTKVYELMASEGLPKVKFGATRERRYRLTSSPSRLRDGIPTLAGRVSWFTGDCLSSNAALDCYLAPNYLVYRFHRLLNKAGLPDMRFHNLRHSAATFLLAMGVHVKIVQGLLGHSNISMTPGTYSHVLPGLQREAMDKWNNWFGEDGDDKNEQEVTD